MIKYTCPVGFVIDAPKLDGKGRDDGRGTKHFAPGEKVYILPMQSYDVAHYERAKVAGYHRTDGKVSIVWIDLRRLENFKTEVVSDSEIIAIISELQQDSKIKAWEEQTANDFVTWRNEIDVKDWLEENKTKKAKDPHPK